MSARTHVARAERHRRRHPVLRRTMLAATSFTTVLAMVSIGVAAYAYDRYNARIDREDVLQPGDRNIAEPKAQLHAANYLIIGSDSRAGADRKYGHEAGQRSDTTILVHLSKDREHVSVVSIPRDSWVRLPACTGSNGKRTKPHSDMFNAAFSQGGAKCTIAAVQQLTGVAVNHYVQVDFAGFRTMVDALGTVTICSPKKVDDPKSRLRLKQGENHLGGEQALAYVRARKTLGDGSDLDRIKRQQRFMGAVLHQATSGSLLSSPSRLTDFLDAATDSVTVDKGTSFNDLRSLAGAMRGLDPKRVSFYTAPIADRDYAPPGTGQTGKVKLDDKAGRALYSAIIHDRTPAASAPARPTARKSASPEPNATGDERSCSL